MATNALSYQWYKDNVAISNATSATLTLTNLTSANAGAYHVVITGVAGTTAQSSDAILTTVAASSLKLVNISTRSYVGTGDSAQIAGFIIGGTQPKRVLIRVSGPALAQYGVSGYLVDPTVTLYNSSTQIDQNDDWGSNAAAIADATTAAGAVPFAPGSKDSAIAVTLAPGGYTAVVTGKNNSTGVALIEVFEADASATASKLVNLSTRSMVLTSDQIQIAGFIINGAAPKKLLIRVSGPALAQYGVSGYLTDPTVALFSGSTQIGQNDDWSTDAATISAATAAAGAVPFAAGSKDSAMVVTLPPGGYTSLVTGKNGSTGIALIEVFEVP